MPRMTDERLAEWIAGKGNWIEWEGETDSALIVALVNNAEAIQRLWDGVAKWQEGYGAEFEQPMIEAWEALRDLCGDAE